MQAKKKKKPYFPIQAKLKFSTIRIVTNIIADTITQTTDKTIVRAIAKNMARTITEQIVNVC